MPRNEEGEFELVLGNRQLLSVFFIVVVLLGVFFVMGYILGKNSSPAPGTDVASARKPAETPANTNPIIIDKPGPKASAAAPGAEMDKPVEQTTPQPPPPKQESKKDSASTKQESPKAEPQKEEPPTAGPGAEVGTGVPPKGSYFLQVAAVGRAEADVVAKVLKGKGFNTWIAPSDNEQIFRVLVGPMQRSEKGEILDKLTGLGFKPFPRTF